LATPETKKKKEEDENLFGDPERKAFPSTRCYLGEIAKKKQYSRASERAWQSELTESVSQRNWGGVYRRSIIHRKKFKKAWRDPKGVFTEGGDGGKELTRPCVGKTEVLGKKKKTRDPRLRQGKKLSTGKDRESEGKKG